MTIMIGFTRPAFFWFAFSRSVLPNKRGRHSEDTTGLPCTHSCRLGTPYDGESMKHIVVGSYALTVIVFVCNVASALSLNKQCLCLRRGGPRTSTRLDAGQESGEKNGLKVQTIGILAGTMGLALGANFLGITTSLLSSTPGAERTILSELYSINGFRKIVTEDYSFCLFALLLKTKYL